MRYNSDMVYLSEECKEKLSLRFSEEKNPMAVQLVNNKGATFFTIKEALTYYNCSRYIINKYLNNGILKKVN